MRERTWTPLTKAVSELQEEFPNAPRIIIFVALWDSTVGLMELTWVDSDRIQHAKDVLKEQFDICKSLDTIDRILGEE